MQLNRSGRTVFHRDDGIKVICLPISMDFVMLSPATALHQTPKNYAVHKEMEGALQTSSMF